MNSIRQIQELNKRELENGVSPEASWHTDYRDTAYIFIGGLPFELSEGDLITIFSQYGEPTYLNLARDKETGKSKGFAFLKYEDQRSTDLAVDNLGGSVVMGRTLRVDHTRYKKKEGEEETGVDLTKALHGTEENEDDEDGSRRKRRRTSESESEEERPMLKEEIELQKLLRDHDDDDPMKAFLIEEKKEEVQMALARVKGGKKGVKDRDRKEKRSHHHRSGRDRDEDEEDRLARRRRHDDRKRDEREHDRDSRRRREDNERRRSRSPDRNRKDDRKHENERRRHRDDTPERPRRRRDS